MASSAWKIYEKRNFIVYPPCPGWIGSYVYGAVLVNIQIGVNIPFFLHASVTATWGKRSTQIFLIIPGKASLLSLVTLSEIGWQWNL